MNVAFITGSRSEWRLVEPLLREASSRTGLTPSLLVTGTHLSPRHGHTLDVIRDSGFKPHASIEILEDRDTHIANARAAGRGLIGFADAFSRLAPDWAVVTGDRYESFSAAAAAALLSVPLAHVAGGETDLSTNYDCNLRNAITKLAHLHLVSHDVAARRVRDLGEESWRVRVVGLPSLDNLAREAAPRDALESAGLVPPDTPFILCSFFPVTSQPAEALQHLECLLAALDRARGIHKLFVLSNSDAGSDDFDDRIRAWAADRHNVTLAPALDPRRYAAALRHAACYVGNSSSGVIEAPLFSTPAIIVGSRQQGRPRASTTIELLEPTTESIDSAIRHALHAPRSTQAVSPYGDGRSAPRVLDALLALRTHPQLLLKRLVPREAP